MRDKQKLGIEQIRDGLLRYVLILWWEIGDLDSEADSCEVKCKI